MTCQICGKPPSPYPNWLIGKGLAVHVGCLVDDYELLLKEHLPLLDEANVSGLYGPWSISWKESWGQKHWSDIADMRNRIEKQKEKEQEK